jgi:hypothetical protein
LWIASFFLKHVRPSGIKQGHTNFRGTNFTSISVDDHCKTEVLVERQSTIPKWFTFTHVIT